MRAVLPIILFLLMCTAISAAEPPKIRTLVKAGFSGLQEPAQMAVTNRTQWAEVWKKHSAQAKPAKPLPEVDFEKETVLLVALGQKRTGGYGVEITNVEELDGKTRVLVKSRAPKPGGFSIQAISSPIHIVAVAKITTPIVFKVE